MNLVGLNGKISTDVQTKMIGSFKVATFLLSVPAAGKWNKDSGRADYGSFAVEVWGKLAESIEKYCEKGSYISVSGNLRQDTWIDQTGANRERTKVIVNNYQFLPSDPAGFTAGEESDESDEFAIDPFDLA